MSVEVFDEENWGMPAEDFWNFVAGCMMIVRDGLACPDEPIAPWFRETADARRAAALVAEAQRMNPDERGGYVMRALGEFDA